MTNEKRTYGNSIWEKFRKMEAYELMYYNDRASMQQAFFIFHGILFFRVRLVTKAVLPVAMEQAVHKNVLSSVHTIVILCWATVDALLERRENIASWSINAIPATGAHHFKQAMLSCRNVLCRWFPPRSQQKRTTHALLHMLTRNATALKAAALYYWQALELANVDAVEK